MTVTPEQIIVALSPLVDTWGKTLEQIKSGELDLAGVLNTLQGDVLEAVGTATESLQNLEFTEQELIDQAVNAEISAEQEAARNEAIALAAEQAAKLSQVWATFEAEKKAAEQSVQAAAEQAQAQADAQTQAQENSATVTVEVTTKTSYSAVYYESVTAIAKGAVSLATDTGKITASPQDAGSWKSGLLETSRKLEVNNFIEFSFDGPGMYGLTTDIKHFGWSSGLIGFYYTSSGSIRVISKGKIIGEALSWQPQDKVRIVVTNAGFELQKKIGDEFTTIFTHSADTSISHYVWIVFGSGSSKVSDLTIGKLSS